MDPNEDILVVKSEIVFGKGYWRGLLRDNLDYYIDLIKDSGSFRKRGEVEEDPLWQQIIPYIIFNFQDRYFLYRFLEKAGEQRLINDYLLGIGGHINPVDAEGGGDILELGMMREWQEEIDYRGKLTEKKLIGIVNDDIRPVEAVHLGLVYLFRGDSPDIFIRESDKLVGGLVSLEELGKSLQRSQNWAKMVYDDYLSRLTA